MMIKSLCSVSVLVAVQADCWSTYPTTHIAHTYCSVVLFSVLSLLLSCCSLFSVSTIGKTLSWWMSTDWSHAMLWAVDNIVMSVCVISQDSEAQLGAWVEMLCGLLQLLGQLADHQFVALLPTAFDCVNQLICYSRNPRLRESLAKWVHHVAHIYGFAPHGAPLPTASHK